MYLRHKEDGRIWTYGGAAFFYLNLDGDFEEFGRKCLAHFVKKAELLIALGPDPSPDYFTNMLS